jgi:UPF0176 protein
MPHIVVCALYKFVALENYQQLRQPLLQLMEEQGIKGTLLLAKEGINGTVSGTRAAIDILFDWFNDHPQLRDIESKESFDTANPFYRTRVKLKKEIVTLGVENVDPTATVGTYVEPEDWNALISDPEVMVIDTRNHYEVEIGTFQNAVNPNTDSFREFPRFAEQNLDPGKHKKIAMFCTGGIRCEKSTAFLKQQGFDQVFHLRGGILKYLETVPEQESLWEGECFVFDNRVAVNQNLEKGSYQQCHACRLPITEEDMQHPHYVQGVSCPHCYDQKDEEQRSRYLEREKQIQLAKRRGEQHIGTEVTYYAERHRLAKKSRYQSSQKESAD